MFHRSVLIGMQIFRAATLCNREGSRSSGVTLAMRHRLCGLSIYGLNGLEREMSTPPTLRRGTADFTFFKIFSPEGKKVKIIERHKLAKMTRIRRKGLRVTVSSTAH